MELDLQGYGILWDMDGVLVDSGDAHFVSWQKAFEEIDREFSYAFFQETFGMNNRGILQKIFGQDVSDDLIVQIGDRKEVLFRESIKGNIRLLPGAETWLKRFQAAGAKQAIASSGPPENIFACGTEVAIEPFFDALVSGYDLPGKPNPDVFLKAANKISTPPYRCLVIEDALAGVAGAVRAKMKCVAVTTTNPREALTDADMIFDSLEEMTAAHIQSLFS